VGRSIVELAETSRTHGERGGVQAEPSVSSALEHLVAGSQGVITKRIDLALLEGQHLLARSIARGALLGGSMLLAAAAWCASAGAGVLFILPDSSPVIRLSAFAVLNAAGAAGFAALAIRRHRPQPRSRANGAGSATAA